MQIKLTVLVPGIRPQNWKRLYDSVGKAFKGLWEIIFIGPYEVPDVLKGTENLTYIEDWGSPIRCQQRALIEAKGEYITWAADDGIFLPGVLDIGFEKLEGHKDTLIMGKYYEGNNDGDIPMQSNEYYNLKNHDGSRLKELPNDVYLMLNVGIVSRELLLEVGGWDCQFEVCPMAYNDLAVRLQNHGIHFIIQDEIMYTCSHLPGHEGDHGPIHDAQIDHDQPLFKKVYDQPNAEKRINIDINNWTEAPERWKRRFN